MKKELLCKRFFLFILGAGGFSPQCFAQELPIKVSRTISFETTEATYLDVDVSPDGQKIVFDILGDIYLLPIIGGEAKQLTRDMANNRRPTWSPNGRYIAYISDRTGGRHLTVMNADGSFPRALEQSDEQIPPANAVSTDQSKKPLWLPNGDFVAVGKDLYNVWGGKYSLPFQDDKKDIQYSRDGKLVYYRDEKGIHQYSWKTKVDSIIAMLPSECIDFQVSPDGRLLTYVFPRGVESEFRARSLVNGRDECVVRSIDKHRIFTEHYSFTADSKTVILGFGGKIHRINLTTGADDTIPFRAHVSADLGPLDYHTFRVTNDSFRVAYTRSANSSPDGRHLVFSALNRIYTMELPNGKPKELINQDAGQFHPIYSPDGEWIAFVTWSDIEGGFLWRVPANGGKPQKLTPVQGFYQHPVWSPDGKFLAVIRQDPDKFKDRALIPLGDLLIVPATGGPSRKITDSLPGDNELSFSQDGKHLIFMQDSRHVDRYERPVPQLYSISIEERKEQILAVSDTKTLYSKLEQVSISPNGRYISFRLRDDLYLVPTTGLDAPLLIMDYQHHVPVYRIARGAVDPHWEKGGEVISWSFGNQFCRANSANIFEEAAEGRMPVPDEKILIQLIEPTKYAHGTIALRNARIITMHGDEVIEHGTIVVTEGRVSDLGSDKSVEIPMGAKIYDVTGSTIMPGLIDLHDHVGINQNIFPQQSWVYLVNLAYGVTTARDPATNYESFGCSELLRTGQMLGPRLFSVGTPVLDDFNIKSLDDARQIVKQHALMGAVAIKQYTQQTRLQKEWLLLASNESGLNMTNEGEHSDATNYFPMIKDGSTGIEHNDTDTWGNVYNDIIKLLGMSGTWLTPTLQVESDDGFPFFAQYYRKHRDSKLPRFWPPANLAYFNELPLPKDSSRPDFVEVSETDTRFHRAGMKVTMGSHGNYAGIGSQFEIWALQMGGLTNMEALKASTIDGAEGLGIQQDLGSLETGKIADLIVLDKNPLDDIHNTMCIRMIMKNGELFDGNTLNSIWPNKKECPEAFGLKAYIGKASKGN